MSFEKTVKIIFGISIAGLLFSGYLSYYELFVPGGCDEAVITCGTKDVTIATLPACVYGFFMYLLIFGLSGFSLFKNLKGNKSD
ncbi:hypothetical protein GF362_07430 [Candidatus Dojkabacteria bacterium]|nr:hypothetical protein [Candidatus Dojkabacteria bacterium]